MAKLWIVEELAEKKRILDIIETSGYLDLLEQSGEMICEALMSGNKIMTAGNGGSAADAQHLAGEIVGRFMVERRSLPALSLCVDPSVMTCIGNDYGFNEVFSRQVEGIGVSGDVFIGISTSGHSTNIINAVITAKEKGISTICFLGKGGGKLKDICDIPLVVPSDETPRIQEIHEFTLHVLCEYVERIIFGYVKGKEIEPVDEIL